MSVTVTIRRLDQDLTVALLPTEDGWRITHALDEAGEDVELSETERAAAVHFADCGMDETGLDGDEAEACPNCWTMVGREAWLLDMIEEADVARVKDREAVVAYLRALGHDVAAEAIAQAGHPLYACLKVP